MHEYISKDAALAALERASIIGSLNAARDNIMAIVAIEAAPVVHGQWTDPENDGEFTAWYCSVCGKAVWTLGGDPDWKYCPNCGKRMDG